MTKPAAATPPARLDNKSSQSLSPACVNGAIAPDTNQIQQFLQLLGKDPATARLRFFPHKHNPKKKQIGARTEVGVDLRAITRHQRWPHGRGAYIAIGNSDGKGDSKENILTVPALFVEWDDKPIDWQKTAWQELGLPEPSIQVATGGASVHTYWLLTSPLPRSEWEPLQKRLIELCGSDDQVKDCTRVMRLPGCAYIGPDGTPTGQTTIISATGKRYDAAQILPPEAEKPPAPPPRQTDRGPLPPRDESAILDALAKVPEFHHDEGRREELLGLALRLWVEVGKDRAHELLAAHSPAITDLDSYFTTEPTQISTGSFWPFVRENYGVDISRRDLSASRVLPPPCNTLPSTAQRAKQPKLTDPQKIQSLRAMASKLLEEKTPFADRVPLLRARAQELDITLRDGELNRLIWDARRAAAGAVDGLGPGDLINLAPTPWHWEGVLMPEALNLLVALPKVGKTSLMLAMIAAWHRGEGSFLGLPFYGPCPPVLIVGTDQPDNDWGRMLQEVGLLPDGIISAPIVRLFHRGSPLHLSPEGIEAIAVYAASHPKLFVLLDSIAALTSPLGLDENSAEISGAH